MKTIGSVGCEIPGSLSEYVPFDSRSSLLEWDIVVFNPNFKDFVGTYHEWYRGKPSLSDAASELLRESTQHWRRELGETLKAGKNIYIFLPELEEVYIDTGERQHSGTGRNRETTRIVSLFNNYEVLPFGIEVTASEGRGMTLTTAGAFLSDYWRQFAEFSIYRVLLSGKTGTSLVVTKSGNKTVGALVSSPDAAGSFVLLPHLDLADARFVRQVKKAKPTKPPGEDDDDEEAKYVWTSEGQKFGSQLAEALLSIDAGLRHSAELTPPPRWTMDPAYTLPKEASLREELLAIEKKLDSLTKEREQKKRQVAEESILRRLLFEKGPRLEAAIIQGLSLLGFKASRYRDSQSEFDIVFEAVEGRVIGEAEGKDNKAINIDKLRQLEMNLHEDFARDCVDQIAKGALFGNAFRLLPLSERPDFFTAKCISGAKRIGCALVRTPDLFLVARYLSDHEDGDFAQRCRAALMASAGDLVSFPIPPSEPSVETSTEKAKVADSDR